MSVNKLALIRYRTIDECLRNRYRKWTLEDLIEKVSEILYETEGIDNGVSKRTVQADIQFMRSDKPGYSAPIVVLERKYYSYSDPKYSITQTPISDTDMQRMKEIVGVLKQFSGFSYFDQMNDMIARLENNLHRSAHNNESHIQFESNQQLKGIELITPLYQAILKKKCLMIEYKSFRAAQSKENVYYPYLLKEYRNRWFLITRNSLRTQLITMALDRIIGFRHLPDETFQEYDGVNFDQYYEDLIGVTKTEKDRAHKVVLFVDKEHLPYVLTKPLHASQQLLKEEENGGIIQIDVVMNFELEREILGFGQFVKVLSPRNLASRIYKRLIKAAAAYETDKAE